MESCADWPIVTIQFFLLWYLPKITFCEDRAHQLQLDSNLCFRRLNQQRLPNVLWYENMMSKYLGNGADLVEKIQNKKVDEVEFPQRDIKLKVIVAI